MKSLRQLPILSVVSVLLSFGELLLIVLQMKSGGAVAPWVLPLHFYLLASLVLVLGLTWFQLVKPKKRVDIFSMCDADQQPSFATSKTFLMMMTIIGFLLIILANYALGLLY